MTRRISPTARNRLISSSPLTGRDFCRALSDATDRWLIKLFDAAREQHPKSPKIALIAVGGYGRGELAPFSDLDVLVIHRSKPERVEALASAMWYPIWDAGIALGHAVRRADEQEALAKSDIDTASSLVTGRFLAGDERMARQVIDQAQVAWRRHRKKWLAEIREASEKRQASAGEVAYTLEPDIKSGHGGLRDVHSLWWAHAAGLAIPPADLDILDGSYETLLRARVGLHRSTARRGEVLRLEDQDAVAEIAGFADADEMMSEISAAARTIAWVSDETWSRHGRVGDGRPVRLAPGINIVEGDVEVDDDVDLAHDPTIVLRVAQASARSGHRIGRHTLQRFVHEMPDWPDRWPPGAVDELVALLLEGHRAIPVLESLDQYSLIERIFPEWAPVRAKPQRNAYHRFTVDRHLWEAAANSAQLAERVQRPDLLVLGALLHDIGKGLPGDHTDVGMDLVKTSIGPRLGLSQPDTDVIVSMVEHHLLLPDVAMRRDLSDPATIALVASQVGDAQRLELLHALTESDSKATGPSAWGSWKEGLVNDLVSRVEHVLGGGDVSDATWQLFPDAATLERMATGETSVLLSEEQGHDRLTVVTPDVPGAFSKVAGVLALHGIDVTGARAHSDEAQPGVQAMAASQVLIIRPKTGVEWQPVLDDLHRALSGELALEARLAERVKHQRRRRATQAKVLSEPTVIFDDEASSTATVIEVHCESTLGVLHRITKALAELDLDIRHATMQTIGMEVVDTFYVRTRRGTPLTDEFHRTEVQRAVLHVVR